MQLRVLEQYTNQTYSQDDVVRARVPTASPEEHIIMPEHYHGINKAKHWTVYDVGGTQSHRGKINSAAKALHP